MGENIPTKPPGTCDEDCCNALPPTLSARLIVPDTDTFEGTLTQTPEVPCQFGGPLAGEFGDVAVVATFCADATDHLNILALGPIGAQCGGVIIENNHCSLPAVKVSAGGCTYTIW